MNTTIAVSRRSDLGRPGFGRTGRSLALALLTALLPVSFAAAAVAPLAEGVLIDEVRGLAYVMSPKGGLEAVDTISGAVVWSSKDAARPLLLVGDTLLAQAEPKGAGKLELVTLDVAAAGGLKVRVESALPEGVLGSVVDTLGKKFRLRAVADGNTALVAWRRVELPGRFDVAAISADAEAPRRVAAPREQEGALRFDLASGATSEVPVGQVRDLARQQQASLAESDPAADGARRFVAQGGRHQLASAKLESEAGRRFRWTLSDSASGRVLGTVESKVAAAPFAVAGERLLVVSQAEGERPAGSDQINERPLELRGHDLASGREAWAVAIRDTTYRGPFPP